MVHLARRDGSRPTVKAAAIAEAEGIPPAFLERLLTDLRGAGLIESVRGPSGGHRLARPPEAITLSEVLAALMGRPTAGGTERLGFLWDRCRQALEEVLSGTVAELADELGRRREVEDYQI
jgi:Rrf2 family protein